MEHSGKEIYIVLSQTNTFPSRFLKFFTHAEYNHVSISLCSDLRQMFSFGRRVAYYPFWGGFISESPDRGVYQRFPNTQVAVLRMEITEMQYRDIRARLGEMLAEKIRWRYNYIGVGLAYFRIPVRRRKCRYCSEFVRNILLQHGIVEPSQLPLIMQPIHFMDIPQTKLIYQGLLTDYPLEGFGNISNKTNEGSSL